MKVFETILANHILCRPMKIIFKEKAEEPALSDYEFNRTINIVRKFYPDSTIDKIMSACRKRELVLIRQITMTILKKKYGEKLSLSAIGKRFPGAAGQGVDHSTVIHAIKSVRDLRDSDKAFNLIYAQILIETEL